MSTNEGRSYVELRADLTKLGADLAAMKARVLAATREAERQATIKITVDTSSVTAALGQIKLLNAAVAKSDETITLDVNTASIVAAQAQLGALESQVLGLDGYDLGVLVTVADAAAKIQLTEIQSKVTAIDANPATVRVQVLGDEAAIAELALVKAAEEAVEEPVDFTVRALGFDAAQARVDALLGAVLAVQSAAGGVDAGDAAALVAGAATVGNDVSVEVDVDSTEALVGLAAVSGAVSSIEAASPVDVSVTTSGVVEATAELEAVALTADELQSERIRIRAETTGLDVVFAQIEALKAEAATIDERNHKINVRLDADAARLAAQVAGQDAALAFAEGIKTGTPAVMKAFSLLASLAKFSVIPAAVLGAGAAAAGGFAVSSAAAIEQVRIAFEGLFQSKEIASDFLGELEQFAAKTPYEFGQLTSSAQRFLGAFGAGFRNELIPTLTTIGNVAATLGAPAASIDRVTTALLQIKGKGRVATEELNQIREALPGFDPLQGIADQLGVSVPEALKKLEKGLVPANAGIDGILASMKEFPGAAGAMERQSATLTGRLSTLKDNLKIVAREGFEGLTTSVGSFVETLSNSLLAGGLLQTVITKFGTEVGGLFDVVAPTLLPFIAELADGAGKILGSLGPAVEKLLPIVQRVIGPVADVIATVLDVTSVFLEEVLTPLLPVVDQLADSLVRLAPSIKTVAEVAGELAQTFGVVLVPILKVFTSVVEAIPVDVLSTLVTVLVALKVAGLAAGAIAAIGPAVAGLAGPVGIAIAGFILLSQVFGDVPSQMERFDEAVAGLDGSLNSLTLTLVKNSEGLAAMASEGDSAAAAYTALGQAIGSLKVPQPTDLSFLQDIGSIFTGTETTDLVSSGLLDISTAAGALGLTAEEVLPAIEAIRTGDWSQLSANATTALTRAREESMKTGDGLDDMTESQIRVADAFQTIADAALNTDFDKLISDSLAYAAVNDESAAKALALAEAQTGLDRNGTNLIPLYREFTNQMRLLNVELEQTPEVVPDYKGFAEAIAGLIPPADRAKLAIAGLAGELETATGQKISFDQQIAKLEELKGALDTIRDNKGTVTSGFNITQGADAFALTTEAGRENAKLVQDYLLQAQGISEALLAQGYSLNDATAIYSSNIETLRSKFIEAGGTADEFDAKLRAYSADPISFTVAFDKSTEATLNAEIEKITKAQPEIAAAIQPYVDMGDYATAQALLDGLATLTPAQQKVFLDDVSRTSTEQALAALADPANGYVATIDARLDPNIDANIRKDLDQNSYEIIVGAKLPSLERDTFQPDPIVYTPQLEPNAQAIINGQIAAAVDEADVPPVVVPVEADIDPEIPQHIKDLIGTETYNVVVTANANTSDLQRKLNAQVYYIRLKALNLTIPLASGGYLRRYEAGGVTAFRDGGIPMGTNIADTPSQFAPGTDGPRYMWGEPSTHGEFFISMHPKHRERNIELWEDAGQRLGQLGTAMAARPVSGPSGGNSELRAMVAQLVRLEKAMLSMPPITVNGDTTEEAGSEVYWANRRRVAMFGAPSLRR